MHCSVRLCASIPTKAKACARIPTKALPPPIIRRHLASSSLLLLFNYHCHYQPLRAQTITTTDTNDILCPADPTSQQQAFLDISIDGEPIGRIIIGLYTDAVPAGAARFAQLVSGRAGVSYRRKEFVKIMPNYVQHGGLRSSYSTDTTDSLLVEWEKQQNEKCKGTKAKSVGIIVRDPSKPPPKMKLVARKGKLVIDEEEVGVDPNGTEFVIAVKDSSELDDSTLVVGRVLDGMDVVERIEQVKTVKENSSSPYFRVAKLIGDKRAVVAERGFNRPYSKVDEGDLVGDKKESSLFPSKAESVCCHPGANLPFDSIQGQKCLCCLIGSNSIDL